MGGEPLVHLHTLPHIAVAQQRAGVHAAVLYDEVVGVYARADVSHRPAVRRVVDYHAVAQRAGALYVHFGVHADVHYRAAVADNGVMPDDGG